MAVINQKKHFRGLVYTVSIYLLLSVVILLYYVVTSSLRNWVSLYSEYVQRLEVFYEQDTVKTTLLQMFEGSGFSVACINNSQVFELNTWSTKNYSIGIDAYALFSQSFTNNNLTINTSRIKVPVLFSKEPDMTIGLRPGQVYFSPKSIEDTQEINGYDIKMIIRNAEVPVGYNWSNLSKSSNLLQSFKVAVQGINGTLVVEEEIDSFGLSILKLLDRRNHSMITIVKNASGALEVHYSSQLEMHLKTKILLNRCGRVYLGAEDITVSASGLSAVGAVRAQ